MITINVWFNHWFSTVIYSFDYLRYTEKQMKLGRVIDSCTDDYKCKIYTTNYCESPVIKSCADHWELEPVYKNPDAYVDWCISFVKEHNINVFFVRRCRQAISKRKREFEALGCKVVAEEYGVESLLNNKEATYKDLAENEELRHLVPDYRMIHTSADFHKAWDYYKYWDNSNRFCIKKAIDEGALSFCELVRGITYKHMMDGTYLPRQITVNDYIKQLEEREKAGENIDSLMLMPYLSDEVSCDCLEYGDKFICITRKSGMNHSTIVSHNKKYAKICKKLYEHFKLQHVANIQFRHDKDGNVKLLEINTRISGGMNKSCEASGINIPILVLYKLMGNEKYHWNMQTDFKDGKEIIVNGLERPVII